MLLVRHALGWFGDAGYEHVEELMAQLEHLSGGTWTLSEDRGGSLTGGGHGYFLIWGAARGLGLPFAAGQALQLVLEAGMLVAFARLGRVGGTRWLFVNANWPSRRCLLQPGA